MRLAQGAAVDLAGRRARQRVQRDPRAGLLVAGKAGRGQSLHLVRRRGTGPEGRDDADPRRGGQFRHRHVTRMGMGGQMILDLGRGDAKAAGIHDVVGPPQQRDRAAIIGLRHVAGHEPVTAKAGVRRVGIVQIAQEQARIVAPDRQRARLSRRQGAIVVQDRDMTAGLRKARRAVGIINEMELLRQVWQDFKDDMQTVLTEDDYEKRMKEYMASGDYRENDIEQLLVYFTFRYIMNAIYDSNIMVYAYLSVMFTMIVRDMNATRFYKNGGSFTIEDQMEVARIFSKEVEHSEENVEAAKEEIIWG